MHIRLLKLWEDLRGSYWFFPGVMIFCSITLSYVTVALDSNYATVLSNLGLIWSGGPEGARSILQTVAGSMITVAGVTFSITMVALSFASSQFGSRLLRSFMTDARNQFVLGTFIATFVFCLHVMGSVRTDGNGGFVPYLSVTVGLVLALVSLVVLIYFIHHMALSMQAPYVIGEVAKDLLNSIDRLFSVQSDGTPPLPETDEKRLFQDLDEEATPLYSDASGYIQAIDEDELAKLACNYEIVIKLPNRPGHFLAEGDRLALIQSGNRIEKIEKEVRKLIIIGKQRTPTQDIEFGIEQLVEVAERSLSSSLNASFTALACIDWLGAAILKLSKKDFPSPYRYDGNGKLRLYFEHPLTLDGVIDTAFNQIRQSAHDNVAVRIRLLEKITLLLEEIEDERAKQTLERHARIIQHDHSDRWLAKEDQDDIQRRYQKTENGSSQRPKTTTL
jgi:uncharacterized membrane protein